MRLASTAPISPAASTPFQPKHHRPNISSSSTITTMVVRPVTT